MPRPPERPPSDPAPGLWVRASLAGLALSLSSLCACALRLPQTGDRVPVGRDTISILSPRCAGVESCLLGHVTTAGSSDPVAKAAVFLERDPAPGEPRAVRIQTLTDEQGVFTIMNPPPGNYRIAIYKNASSIEVMGMELGRRGTTVLPIRLATR